MSNQNNIEVFLNNFNIYGDAVGVIWKNKNYTYNHLLSRSEYWKTGISDIAEGSIVGLTSDFTPETIAILFALIANNNIIVPFDINHRNKNESKIQTIRRIS